MLEDSLKVEIRDWAKQRGYPTSSLDVDALSAAILSNCIPPVLTPPPHPLRRIFSTLGRKKSDGKA